MKFEPRQKTKVNAAMCGISAFAMVIGFGNPLIARASERGEIIPPSQWWEFITYSPDGTRVAVQTPPNEILETTLPDGNKRKCQHEVKHKTVILNAKDFTIQTTLDAKIWPIWSPDGRFFCDHEWFDKFDYVLYDSSSGKMMRGIKGKSDPDSLAWAPDSSAILLAQPKSLTIVDLSKGKDKTLPIKLDESMVNSPTWSPDCKSVAACVQIEDDITAAEKNTFAIKIWDTKSTKIKSEIKVQNQPGMIAWSPTGRLFIYSQPSSIIVLDAVTMAAPAKLATSDIKALGFCWSPDKKHFAYSDDGIVHILDAVTMQETAKITGATNGFFRVVWSPDSHYILLSDGTTAAICDIKTGKYLGHKTWEDSRIHIITPDQKGLIVQGVNSLTAREPLTLPPKPDMSPFDKGKLGSPGWENNATPKTLEEAFAEFDKDLIPANRQRFKRAGQSDICKFGGGSYTTDRMMADVYCKWNFAPLYKFFLARGITDPRDVDSILLDSYWRHLNDKPIDLDTQISRHKAYRDDQKTIISPNKQLPDEIWRCPLKTSSGAEYSLSTTKAKLQIITFLMANDFDNLTYIESLKNLRKNSPAKNLAITVCVIPASSITRSYWSIETKNKSADPCKDVEKLLQDSKEIIVTEAPPQLIRAFFRMLKTRDAQFGPPQTFFIDETGILKYRVQRADNESTSKILDKLVKKSL